MTLIMIIIRVVVERCRLSDNYLSSLSVHVLQPCWKAVSVQVQCERTRLANQAPSDGKCAAPSAQLKAPSGDP